MPYLLFVGECFYPGRANEDFVGAFPSVAAAQDAFTPMDSDRSYRHRWAIVVVFDGTTMTKVSEWSNDNGTPYEHWNCRWVSEAEQDAEWARISRQAEAVSQ